MSIHTQRQKETQGQRETEINRDRESERDPQSGRHADRQRGRERVRQKQRPGKKETEREKQRQRERGRQGLRALPSAQTEVAPRAEGHEGVLVRVGSYFGGNSPHTQKTKSPLQAHQADPWHGRDQRGSGDLPAGSSLAERTNRGFHSHTLSVAGLGPRCRFPSSVFLTPCPVFGLRGPRARAAGGPSLEKTSRPLRKPTLKGCRGETMKNLKTGGSSHQEPKPPCSFPRSSSKCREASQ